MKKVLIKSIFDRKAHRHFYWFHSFRNSLIMYFLFIFAILIFYMAIRASVSGDGNVDNSMIWMLGASSIVIVPFIMTIRILVIVNGDAKRRGLRQEIIEFNKNQVIRKIEGAGRADIYTWPMIDRIYERKDYYYVYTQKDQGFVVVKNDIVEGDIEKLDRLITDYMKPDKKGRLAFKRYKKGKKQ